MRQWNGSISTLVGCEGNHEFAVNFYLEFLHSKETNPIRQFTPFSFVFFTATQIERGFRQWSENTSSLAECEGNHGFAVNLFSIFRDLDITIQNHWYPIDIYSWTLTVVMFRLILHINIVDFNFLPLWGFSFRFARGTLFLNENNI